MKMQASAQYLPGCWRCEVELFNLVSSICKGFFDQTDRACSYLHIFSNFQKYSYLHKYSTLRAHPENIKKRVFVLRKLN